MANELLLSDDPQEMASGIKQAIKNNADSDSLKKAKEGVRYYNYDHDILQNRIMYVDSNNILREDKYASNLNIQHPFLPELIDQKVQVLLANPLEIEVDDPEFKRHLESYYDEDFQVFLDDLLTNGSQMGFEYAYARTTSENRLTFQIADGLKVIPIYDNNNTVVRLLRYYTDEILKDGKKVKVNYAEMYDKSKVWYFIEKDKEEGYKLDVSKTPNPAPHVLAINDDGELAGFGYGVIPFYRYKNNQKERTDLEPIKALIDDYDLMSTFLSNNLQDFADAIYVVKGFEGDNLDKLRFNLKNKKTVGVGENGSVDVKTVNVPVEGRKTKMQMDKEAIYKFGFGFDTSQIADSNGSVTNVVIKAGFSLLNMKVNKTEVRLRAFLKWANNLVVQDINRLNGTDYNPDDVGFIIEREMLINEKDLVDNEKTEADKRSIEVQTLLAAAPLLPDDKVLKMICEIYELDYDEIAEEVETQDYQEPPATE
ncbi:phage portal protein [Lactococcus petauri]|uniref:phage portal protein n=1 Tax=Lactococcus petauri TaxID=1940789 RepID=UPI0022DF7436|nr:phage portal protein [Lactococcus petauri]